MKIRANVGGAPGAGSLAIYSAPGAFENPGHTYMSRFTSDGYTQVTANEYYWLCLSAPAGNDVWWYATTPSSYDNGFLQLGIGGSKANEDFGFQIWSSNMQDPVVTPDPTPEVTPDTTPATTPAASTPLPTGVTAGSGAAPVTPTASIKSATEVTISDVPADQGGSLKLDWKASTTTDITGYKVFRSTTEVTKDFKEIVKTEKTIVTYTDNTATIGQKFYYMVRAYKGTAESASSNVVNSTSLDNLAPGAPKNVSMKKASDTEFNFTWDANTEADLAGYVLSAFSSDDDATVIDTIEIDKAAVSYKLLSADHPKLIVGTSYIYYLQAKDANNNLSEKVIAADDTVVATTAAATPAESSSDWVLIIAIIALVLLAGAVTYLELKAKKDSKKVSAKLLYPLIALAVIAAGLIIWRVMPADENTTVKTEEAAVVAPKHADWPVFESAKNGFKLYYPAEYTVTEGAGGNVSINKGADIMAEIHSYNNDGDDAGMMRASGALYMDAAKGYMTGGVESSTTAAGESAKRYTGTFGKNAGAKVMVHDGIKGSVVMFTKNSKTWMFHSFDNGVAAAITIFEDMITDMKF